MKYVSSRYSIHLCSLIIVCFVFISQIHAQTDRNALKLESLKSKVDRAQLKVSAAELKLAVADSLITTGETNIQEAEQRFSQLGTEQKQLAKEYKANSKTLKKEAKSKDPEIAKKAIVDQKALDAQFKADSKKQTDEIKVLTKKAMKGQSDVKKGEDMEKTTLVRLKDSQNALDLAKENYQAFKMSLEGGE